VEKRAIKGEYITLGNLLQKVNIAQTGGQAKILVKQLDIKVNNEKEDRRGRKLYPGDLIDIEGREYLLIHENQ